MDQSEIESGLAGIIREELQDDTLVVKPETELADIPGWDSVTMSCVMIAVEQHFGFEFAGNELDELSTFRSLVGSVMDKRLAAN